MSNVPRVDAVDVIATRPSVCEQHAGDLGARLTGAALVVYWTAGGGAGVGGGVERRVVELEPISALAALSTIQHGGGHDTEADARVGDGAALHGAARC